MLLPLLAVLVVVVVTDGDGVSGGSRRLASRSGALRTDLPPSRAHTNTHDRSVKNGSRYAVLPALSDDARYIYIYLLYISDHVVVYAMDDEDRGGRHSFTSLPAPFRSPFGCPFARVAHGSRSRADSDSLDRLVPRSLRALPPVPLSLEGAFFFLSLSPAL